MTPGQAVFTLAFPEKFSDEPPDSAPIQAVETLCKAPPSGRWNRGLFLGLRSPSGKVVSRTVRACIQRLENLPDEHAKDRFLGEILDECFVNLSGVRKSFFAEECENLFSQKQEKKIPARHSTSEKAAAELLNAVACYLKKNPLKMEHHRSRLLSHARRILHMEGMGAVAESVVAFQRVLAEEDTRGDNLAAEMIRSRRKRQIYESADSSEPTLLAYLEKDAELGIENVSQELFKTYRTLLFSQTKERAPRAILKAMDNLSSWFESIHPFNRFEERGKLLEDSVRASALVPWEDLSSVAAVRHMEAHLELLPGPDHPEDFIRLLTDRYASPEGEPFLVRGLGLLSKMPMIRFRSGEIRGFMLGAGRLKRSETAWDVFFELMGTMVTGLADFVLTAEALSSRDRRRNRAMKKVLATDAEIRDSLRRMSTDTNFRLSNDPALDGRIREKSWRVLLRSLPPDRKALFREGLLTDRFFHATLEEAGTARQREIWETLDRHRDDLFGDTVPENERRERTLAVMAFFKRVRVSGAVVGRGRTPGFLVGLAMDDLDPDVKALAGEVLVNTGYDHELVREREKRRLLELRDRLTESNEIVRQYEDEVASVTEALLKAQSERLDHSLNVQELMQKRDILATRGWIATSELHTQLEELRIKLEKELSEAKEHSAKIDDLRGRMSKKIEECKGVNDIVTILDGERERHEKERLRLDKEKSKTEKKLAKLREQLADTEAGLEKLRIEHTFRPSFLDNAEDAREAVEKNEKALRAHGQKQATLDIEIGDCLKQTASFERGISAATNAISKLNAEIDGERERIRSLQEGLMEIRVDYETNHSIWQSVRDRIANLSEKIEKLERKFDEKQAEARVDLKKNTSRLAKEQTALQQIAARMQTLSNTLNQVTENRDNQITQSQEIARAIDSGRHRYDTLSEQADQLTAKADAEGFSLQARREQEIVEDQEFGVHYAWGVWRGLRNKMGKSQNTNGK